MLTVKKKKKKNVGCCSDNSVARLNEFIHKVARCGRIGRYSGSQFQRSGWLQPHTHCHKLTSLPVIVGLYIVIMITPAFELSQDPEYLIITIRVPYTRTSEFDLYIDGTDFKFYAKPYFLR